VISTLLNAPFYTGQNRSVDVPGKWDCSINGRGYMIDLASGEGFSRRSIPLLRNQANTGEQFGEASLNPEGLWRRSQDSWDHGAGQTHLDRDESDRRRFRSSKGIDVWNRWQISLLPDTASKRASTSTNLALQPVGTFLYLTDGTALLYTTSLTGTPTWTTVTGTPATAPSSIASDGFNVYTAHGAAGVYRTTRGAATTASHNTLAATLLGYVKGRLMAANGASIFNITSTTVPAALYTQPNTDFTWVGFAEGQSVIYAAGFSGDKSLIYRTAIKADGTALDVPVIAGELPDGEIVRSIDGYLGFVLLGTDMGVRFCASDTAGNLTIGALIRTSSAVRCFEGQDRFVWFGWTNYDGVSTGLGRMDLSTFITSLTPAYASDLMATTQGNVTSVATFANRRVFAVSGVGVFSQTTSLVPSGTLDTGLISYGLVDPKAGMLLDVRLSSFAGTNTASVAVDGGPFAQVGIRSGTSDDEAFQVGQRSGENFEVRHTLTRSATDTSAGPVVTRYTLHVYPKQTSGQVFVVPLLLHERVRDRLDNVNFVNVRAEQDELITLQTSRKLVVYQTGTESHTVLIDDSAFAYSHPTSDGKAWNGTHNVRLKELT
jgi:hypothetical protein